MSTPIAVVDVAVNQTSSDENPNLLQRWHLMTPQIAFGAASGKSYDTNGIPLPPLNNFRLKQSIYRMPSLQPVAPDGKVYQYDPTPRAANPVAPNGTIRIFTGGTEFSGDVPVTTLNLEIIGA